MRCTRCDRLAIPQAVGRTPEGLVVFGWCVNCLEEVGCDDIQVVASKEPPRRPESRTRPDPTTTRAADPGRGRRLGAAVVALLGGWSLVLLGAGGWMLRGRRPGVPSPFGNGTPALLLAGGAGTAATCLLIAGLTFGRGRLRSRVLLRGLKWGVFLVAAVLLLWGAALHGPWPLVAAVLGLVLIVAARRQGRWLRPIP